MTSTTAPWATALFVALTVWGAGMLYLHERAGRVRRARRTFTNVARAPIGRREGR